MLAGRGRGLVPAGAEYEEGTNRITAGALYQLAIKLEVPVQYFFEADDDYWRRYQQYAHQCARWVAQADNYNERETFLEMAQAWKRIALVEQDVRDSLCWECHQVALSVSSISPA